jgi:hypothetical protein
VSSTAALLLADARGTLERTVARRPQTDLAIVFGYWTLMKATDATEAQGLRTKAGHMGPPLPYEVSKGKKCP